MTLGSEYYSGKDKAFFSNLGQGSGGVKQHARGSFLARDGKLKSFLKTRAS